MLKQPSTKVRAFAPTHLANRSWPDARIVSGSLKAIVGALTRARIAAQEPAHVLPLARATKPDLAVCH